MIAYFLFLKQELKKDVSNTTIDGKGEFIC